MIRSTWMVMVALTVASCADEPLELPPLEVASVEVAPSARTLAVGDTLVLTAYPRTADGQVLGSVRIDWHIEDPAVAALSVTGGNARIIAVAAGATKVAALADGKRGEATLTVAAAPIVPVSLTVTPAAGQVVVNGTIRLEAVLRAEDGSPVGGRIVTWTSSDSPTAVVHADASTAFGTVTGLRPGSVRITARSGQLSAETEITVRAASPTVTAMIVSPTTRSLWPGHVFPFVATPVGPNGGPVSTAVTWSVADTTIATIDADGLVLAREPGTTTVEARAGGVTGRATLRVVPLPGPLAQFELLANQDELGMPRVTPVIGTTTWTDAAGAAHPADIWLMGGSLTLDRSEPVQVWTQELKLFVVVRDPAGQATVVETRTIVDQGHLMYRLFDGAFMLVQDDGGDAVAIARYRDAEHLVVEQAVGVIPTIGYLYRVR